MIEKCRLKVCRKPSARLPYTAIETICLREGQQWGYTTQENEILYSNYGLIHFSSDHSIDTGTMIILPPGCTFSARAGTAVSLYVIRARRDFRLSSCIGIEVITSLKQDYFQPVNIPQNVSLFFTLLAEEQGWELLTEPFMEVKILELFILLKAYYPKEDLVRVFYPFFQNDSSLGQITEEHKFSSSSQFCDLALSSDKLRKMNYNHN